MNNFEQMGFKCSVKSCATVEMIKQRLILAEKPDLRHGDCFITAIKAYADDRQLVFGHQQAGLQIKDILQFYLEEFSPKKCSSLRGRPKILIIDLITTIKNWTLLKISSTQSILEIKEKDFLIFIGRSGRVLSEISALLYKYSDKIPIDSLLKNVVTEDSFKTPQLLQTVQMVDSPIICSTLTKR